MIVGLGHRSRMGKDTAANYMVEWLKENRPELTVKKLNWASPLKFVSHYLYGHLGLQAEDFYNTPEGEALRDVKLPGIDKTPVEIWIDVGQAIRERVYEMTWRDYVKNLKYDVVICADTRFLTETSVCDFTIKVHNPRVPNRGGKTSDEYLADYTGWNYLINNDSCLGNLRRQTIAVARQIFGTP